MPFKNEAAFLGETLNSIKNQSYTHWECICIDDNSEDSSAEIVSAFEERDKRFKYLPSSGHGVISALQCGHIQSKGKFITRMDADDLMPEKKLELLLELLVRSGEGVIATGKVSYFNALGEGFIRYQNWLNQMIDENSHRQNIYKECVIASPNWMMSVDDFKAIGAFNSDIYPEDYDLIFRSFEKNLKVASTKEVTHLWRDHENRASRTSDLYMENTFVPLKVSFFIKLTLKENDKLTIWGVGKKGKAIAKEFINRGVSFKWVTNNPNKIGHIIYGVLIEDVNSSVLENKFIAAVSQPEDLKKKQKELESKGLRLGVDYFVFV